MRYMVQCLRELAVLALRCGKYEDAPRYLEEAAELDRKIKSGIIENRYSEDQPRDDHGRWTSGGSSGISGSETKGSISGAISGALDPDSSKANEHAERYYESVRKMSSDCKHIAENTGFSEEEIKRVKNFIFLEKHDLGGSEPERFYPDYDMAQSWQRLIDGKNIQPHDITLLRHELMEDDLMKKGLTQKEAHKQAEHKYHYGEECKNYHAGINKHKT